MNDIESVLGFDCFLEVVSYLGWRDLENYDGGIDNELLWKILVSRDFEGVYVSKRMVVKCGGWQGIYICLESGMRWKDFIGL